MAFAADGTPIAWENRYNKGTAIIFGSFAGQQNYQHPVAMHPLAKILSDWTDLSHPNLHAPSLLELREMQADGGRWVFFFNHADSPATLEFARTLERPASRIREITAGHEVAPTGTRLSLKAAVPAQRARIYRIDF